MEVKFVETCAIASDSTHAQWSVGCQFVSGGRPTTWEFLLAIKRPHGTTYRAWARDDEDIQQIFAKMAGLGYEAVIINCRQLENCASAAGVDLNRVVDLELTINLPGARGQASKMWARSAIAPGGWYSFQELQNDPSRMQKLFATARAC
eukprot:329759-Rhodomonas_salina.1